MGNGLLLALFVTVVTAFICSGVLLGPGSLAQPVYKDQVILRAKGSGIPRQPVTSPAEARLLAERAAVVDGYRNLLEQAYGLQVVGTTVVRDFVTQSDTLRAHVDAFLRGARVIETRYLDDGAVEVDMEVTLGRDFWVIFRPR